MPARSLLERYGLPAGQIERVSLQRLEQAAAPHLPLEAGARRLALRILYAAGDPDLALHLRVHPDAIAAGVAALRQGAPVVVDVSMVAAGLQRERLARLGCEVLVAVQQPRTSCTAPNADSLASSHAATGGRDGSGDRITRTASGMRLLIPRLAGGVVAIGNAPTALLALLDALDAGAEAPALIVGLPVGMVAAAESKAELLARQVPYVTLLGTRGGSPLAAAALNALTELALDPADGR